MRIELRDEQRRRIGRVVIDSAQRPTRVVANAHRGDPGREAFLNWESALDDAGQLRRCVACGCNDLFREKAFPQVTAFVVVLAFVGAILGLFGLAENTPVLIAMAIVLVLDIAILLFSHRRLVCYQCRSTYRDLPIASYHRPWDRAKAERYQMQPQIAQPSGSAVSANENSAKAKPIEADAQPISAKPKSYFA